MAEAEAEVLRRLPSVSRVLAVLERRGLLEGYPRAAATRCARDVLERARQRLREGGDRAAGPGRLAEADVVGVGAQPPGRPGAPIADEVDGIADEVALLLRRQFGTTLRRAVNATGILLHTNLGRAPLSAAAVSAAADAAAGYSTLEVDLERGERGRREVHVEGLLAAVTGAETGTAVNNAAGAVLLALATLAAGRPVAVSRGELVEIGGAFRLPDVMRQSGAALVEVGTTNRTALRDYEAALDRGAALLLKVHRSNFAQTGFVSDATLGDLVVLGRRRGVPVVYDLGSGCLVDLREAGLPAEPTVQEAVAVGVDLVIFSGDKLLGGPQSGMLVGRQAAVEAVRRHPLARALRLDKVSLAALAATLRAYLDPDAAWREIPLLALLRRSPAQRRRLARRLAGALAAVLGDRAEIDVVSTAGEVGAGSLPGVRIPSAAVTLRPAAGSAEAWARGLRTAAVPVVALVRDDTLLLDVLALLPGEERRLPRLVAAAAPA